MRRFSHLQARRLRARSGLFVTRRLTFCVPDATRCVAERQSCSMCLSFLRLFIPGPRMHSFRIVSENVMCPPATTGPRPESRQLLIAIRSSRAGTHVDYYSVAGHLLPAVENQAIQVYYTIATSRSRPLSRAQPSSPAHHTRGQRLPALSRSR
ncbi:hypothetical protein EXIGLDRAFT_723692 [Exidia glandulosa HHB12029]|uniref:Uncharacterized protein n=1 Tax=Exidia glandulosa HHB12029 TaxID=1314781 RepID=A0A165EQF4_EXIGL|nr:hypothetical protein EXIGLDRAFT_723692 [Exidia glandulosa HHB12029]